MADTFGTISFTMLQSNWGRRTAADVALQHIPGSNVTYIDAGGQTATEVSYDLLFATSADYTLMAGTVGGTAQLYTVADGTITCALLRDLSRTFRVPADGKTFEAASFVIVTA